MPLRSHQAGSSLRLVCLEVADGLVVGSDIFAWGQRGQIQAPAHAGML